MPSRPIHGARRESAGRACSRHRVTHPPPAHGRDRHARPLSTDRVPGGSRRIWRTPPVVGRTPDRSSHTAAQASGAERGLRATSGGLLEFQETPPTVCSKHLFAGRCPWRVSQGSFPDEKCPTIQSNNRVSIWECIQGLMDTSCERESDGGTTRLCTHVHQRA